MPFTPFTFGFGKRTDWDRITHIRLVPGVEPHRAEVREFRRQLVALADDEGLIEKEKALALPAYRPSKGIRSDLRNWSNKPGHGNNNQDKGWLELGRVD